MNNTHRPLKSNKTTIALLALITFPLILTLTMWVLLPSGYQRFMDKKNHAKELPSINHFVTGIKPLTIFL